MAWKTLLAYSSGSIDEALLLRSEYLTAENRILRDQINGRVQLSKRRGLPPAPERKKTTTWREFIRTHSAGSSNTTIARPHEYFDRARTPYAVVALCTTETTSMHKDCEVKA